MFQTSERSNRLLRSKVYTVWLGARSGTRTSLRHFDRPSRKFYRGSKVRNVASIIDPIRFELQ